MIEVKIYVLLSIALRIWPDTNEQYRVHDQMDLTTVDIYEYVHTGYDLYYATL